MEEGMALKKFNGQDSKMDSYETMQHPERIEAKRKVKALIPANIYQRAW